MAFLLAQGTQTDRDVARACDVAAADLFRRDVFARLLETVRGLNFASVKSHAVYLVPRDEDWGLTVQDLAAPSYGYLRVIV